MVPIIFRLFSFWRGDIQLLTYLLNHTRPYLRMSCYGRTFTILRIVVHGMFSAFPQKLTPVHAQMPLKVAALHTSTRQRKALPRHGFPPAFFASEHALREHEFLERIFEVLLRRALSFTLRQNARDLFEPRNISFRHFFIYSRIHGS